eukprot:tig00001299_g8075.t1
MAGAATRPPRRRLRVLAIALVLGIVAYVATRPSSPSGKLAPRTSRTTEEEQQYGESKQFWSTIKANDDGVMAGYSHISKLDTDTTLAFTRELMKLPPGEPTQPRVAIDCGAGVGRVTKGVLVHDFTEIDVLEQEARFLDKARENLKDSKRKINFIQQGMHEFAFEAQRYDLVLIDWSAGYLTDEDLVDLLTRARFGLKAGGALVFKDNVARERFQDGKDKQRIRDDATLKALFEKAGYKLLAEKVQEGFPAEIVPVKMYGLRPEDS